MGDTVAASNGERRWSCVRLDNGKIRLSRLQRKEQKKETVREQQARIDILIWTAIGVLDAKSSVDPY
jgi:hypothetical protein